MFTLLKLVIVSQLNLLEIKDMKGRILVFVLLGIITLNSCKKKPVVISPVEELTVVVDTTEEVKDTVRVYYDETFCADPWGGLNSDSEDEKKTKIENYFIDLEIELFEIKKTEVNSPETFFLCVAKTGYIFEFKIREEDVDTLINEGFYQ